MSNDLFKRNCAVLAQWYAGECKEELQKLELDGTWSKAIGDSPKSCEYRIKPRTILVNGIEVPEPVRKIPNKGDPVWYVDVFDKNGYWIVGFGGADTDMRMLDRGLIHMTKEAAARHFEALIAPSKRSES